MSEIGVAQLAADAALAVTAPLAASPLLKDEHGFVFPATGTAYTPAEQHPPPSGALTVVHADAAFLVVDKPAYLTVENTISNKDSVRSRLEAAGHARLHLAHRLDWETSGLLVVALDAAAASALSQQFAGRSVAKVYVADCVATPPAARGEVDLPLAADGERRPRQRVDTSPAGKPAVTRWEVAAALPSGRCRVRLVPETGRRHQLRMHMLALGCPLVGDALYGEAGSGRMHLHAAELSFDHPTTGERVTFSSEPPFALADDDAPPPPQLQPRVPTLRALCESQLASTFAALRDVEADVAAQRSELSARKDALLVELGEVSESLEALYVSHANLRATRDGLADGVRDALGAAAEEVLRRVEPPD